ncbi:pilus assembly protein [Acidovorax sp. Root217]|uniref:pilus assembly protein n=1 Tax=Acidovorax sp. Root217 TaxID=1736492 RepID=UPI00070D37B1|nr:PilC/PilY family type IV pilus protein [Acidovorax sp. Root217]KRC24029.1 pilus assembly protein PilC [Acidovorax sp. Root217]
MHRTAAPRFRKHLIALAASAALAPHGAWALDLAQSPPGTVEPYVSPNVIISIDDSGSMEYRLDSEASTSNNQTTPNVDGTWPASSKRINVLKYTMVGSGGTGGIFRDTTLLPDKKIRLSWQAMWNNGGSTDALNVNSSTMKTNSMRRLNTAHRNNFISFISNLKASNGTPSHLMFKQADEYMRQPLGTSSAWASDPGTTGNPYLACRRSYHIMMTDGRWNGTAYDVPDTSKRDNATNLTLPDSNVYGGSNATERAKTALYRDTVNNTLADWAFYSWANPMQTSGLTGTMQPAADYRKAPATENFGKDTANKDAILERYWNPRYNPATWTHMVTYTIGFSTVSTTWPGAPTIFGPTEQTPFGYDGSFRDFVTGTKTWPTMDNENKRSLDLWHAALNGRGRFYAVTKGEDLEKAFREIFGQINTATDPDLSASATSGSNISRSEVGRYTAAYEPTNDWKGFVTAERLKPDGTSVSDSGWNGKNTADKLDALATISTRLILSWSDKWDTSKYRGGVPFKWASDEANLSTAQKVWLQKNVGGTDQGATKGQERLEYIRGERSKEGSDDTGYTTAKPYRERQSRQGDIINSDVWYVGPPAGDSLLKGYANFVRNEKSRQPMIYVGGNDGMLHGFSTADGQEKLAYVPQGVIPTLTLLTDPQYNNKHRYFVDGSPMTGDIDANGGIQDPTDPNYAAFVPDWRTYLVGTLGLGGKGYFVLDVTNPTATASPSGIPGFAEGNAQTLVKLDRTRGSTEAAPICGAMTGAEKTMCDKVVEEDKDIGHITSRPVRDTTDTARTTQITRMNNNRWAVVLGNGYNSTNQRPVLLIQYLDGLRELVRLPTTTQAAGTGNAKDNGLGAPRVVDLDGDGRIDVAYAGDNLGNMWKFDLTSATPGNWKVAFGGSPLFTAQGPAALNNASRTKIQPISTAPTVRANDRKKQTGSGPTATTSRVGGMMVAFGTGRNVDAADPSNVDVQSLYSVLDNTRYRYAGTGASKRLEVHPGGGSCPNGADCVPAPAALGTGVATAKLAQQKFTDVSGENAKVDIVDELKLETWGNYNGWYMDLPAVGERLLKPLEFYDATNLLTVWSQVPAKGSNVDPNVESCESTSVDGERQYRTFVNIMDGKRPTFQIVDLNLDKKYDAADKDVSRVPVTKGPHSLVRGKKEIKDYDGKGNFTDNAPPPEESMRPSWRQIR